MSANAPLAPAAGLESDAHWFELPELRKKVSADDFFRVKRYSSSSEFDCSYNKYNCANFDTHVEAQKLFETCGGTSNDVHHLDGDQDGSACETLQ